MFDPRMYRPKKRTPKPPTTDTRLPSLAYVRLLHALLTNHLTSTQREMLETLVATGQDSVAMPASEKASITESTSVKTDTDINRANQLLTEQGATIATLRRQLAGTRQTIDSLNRRVARMETEIERTNRFTS